ncbi:AsmA family protein, partial [Thermodesulfobacteriota bacterium]
MDKKQTKKDVKDKKGFILFRAIKRLLKVTSYLILLLIVIGTILTVLVKSEHVQNYVKNNVRNVVKEELKINADFSDFSLNFFPIAFDLNNVTLSQRAKRGKAQQIRIDKVRLLTWIKPVRAIKLILGKDKGDIEINNIQLIKLRADIITKDGTSGWEDVIVALKEKSEKSPENDESAKKNEGQKIIIKKVELRDSYVNFVDLDEKSEYGGRGIDIRLDTENISEKVAFFSKIRAVKIKNADVKEELNNILMDGEFLTDKNWLSLKKARIFNADRSELELSGIIFFEDKISYKIDLNFEARDKSVKRYLPDDFKFVGTYNYIGTVRGKESDFRLTGKVKSEIGNIYGIDFKNISLDIELDNDSVYAKNITGIIFDGKAVGSYKMRFDTAPDFYATLKLTDASMTAIEKGCPAVPGLLSGRISGTAEVDGKFEGGYFLDIKADLTSDRFVLHKDIYTKKGKENEERMVFRDVKLKTAIEISEKGLLYKKLHLETADFDIDVSGSMPEYTKFDLQFDSDVKDLAFLKVPLGITEELSGRGHVEGGVRDDVDNPTIKASLKLSDVLYDNILIDKVNGSAALIDMVLSLNEIKAAKDDFRFTVNGGIDLSKKAKLNLGIDIDEAYLSNINALLESIDVERVDALDDISGNLAGSVKIIGDADNIIYTFETAAPKAKLYGEPTALSLSGKGSMASIKIIEAIVKRDEMYLIMSGNIDYSGTMELNYTSHGLRAKNLLKLAKKDGIEFDAKVASSGKIIKNDDAMTISSNFELSEVTYLKEPLKGAKFILKYDENGINIFGDFFDKEIALDLNFSGDDLNNVTLDGEFENFDPAGLLASIFNLRDVSCKIDGAALINTTLNLDDLSDLDSYFKNTKLFKTNIVLKELTTKKYKFEESKASLDFEKGVGTLKVNVLDNKAELESRIDYTDQLDVTTTFNVN